MGENYYSKYLSGKSPSILPSIDDIREDFPPKDPKYMYDEYGFPYLEYDIITLTFKLNGEMQTNVVGYYTEKSKFESATNKMLALLKKGANFIDFSSL